MARLKGISAWNDSPGIGGVRIIYIYRRTYACTHTYTSRWTSSPCNANVPEVQVGWWSTSNQHRNSGTVFRSRLPRSHSVPEKLRIIRMIYYHFVHHTPHLHLRKPGCWHLSGNEGELYHNVLDICIRRLEGVPKTIEKKERLSRQFQRCKTRETSLTVSCEIMFSQQWSNQK